MRDQAEIELRQKEFEDRKKSLLKKNEKLIRQGKQPIEVPTQALTHEEMSQYSMKFKGYKEAFNRNQEMKRQMRSMGSED